VAGVRAAASASLVVALVFRAVAEATPAVAVTRVAAVTQAEVVTRVEVAGIPEEAVAVAASP
jgi:hypothetical protein